MKYGDVFKKFSGSDLNFILANIPSRKVLKRLSTIINGRLTIRIIHWPIYHGEMFGRDPKLQISAKEIYPSSKQKNLVSMQTCKPEIVELELDI